MKKMWARLPREIVVGRKEERFQVGTEPGIRMEYVYTLEERRKRRGRLRRSAEVLVAPRQEKARWVLNW